MESIQAMVLANSIENHIQLGGDFSVSDVVEIGGMPITIMASGTVSDAPITDNPFDGLLHSFRTFWGILKAVTEIAIQKRIEFDHSFRIPADEPKYFNVKVIVQAGNQAQMSVVSTEVPAPNF